MTPTLLSFGGYVSHRNWNASVRDVARDRPKTVTFAVLNVHHPFSRKRIFVVGDLRPGRIGHLVHQHAPPPSRPAGLPVSFQKAIRDRQQGSQHLSKAAKLFYMRVDASGRHDRLQRLEAYPYLEPEDIDAALAYAAWRLEEREEPLVAS